MMVFTPVGLALALSAIVMAIGYALYVEAQQLDLSTTDVPPHHEARLVQLDRMSIEQAYSQQITFLFQQWMKDPAGQPARALRGTRQARTAYSEAMTAIERREGPK